MQPVLDAPVAAVEGEQARRGGPAGGDADDAGDGLAGEPGAELGGAGEHGLVSGCLAGWAGGAGADVAHRLGARVAVALDEEDLPGAGPAGPDGLGGRGGADDAHVETMNKAGLDWMLIAKGNQPGPEEAICSFGRESFPPSARH